MEFEIIEVVPVEHKTIRAEVGVQFDNQLKVYGLKLISGKSGMFLAMPSRKNKSTDQWEDLVTVLEPLKTDIFNTAMDIMSKQIAHDAGVESSDTTPQDIPF
jgi:DNA-binding cell septation regulator SpoVG